MKAFQRIAAAAVVTGLLSPLASAQAPAQGQPPNQQPRRQAQGQPAQQGVAPNRNTNVNNNNAARPNANAANPNAARRNATQTRTAYRPAQYYPYNYNPEQYRTSPGYNSIVRHSPPPHTYHYRSPYADNSQAGFRNPGGVGKFEEFYPAGDEFQNGGRDPVMVAGFNQNLPERTIQSQAMATNVGTMRYSAMQQHIDNFARPMGFWGLGFGYGAY